MNRQIKFRAWDKNENIFIYSDLNDPLCHMNGYSNDRTAYHFISTINNLSDGSLVSFKNTYTENLEGCEQFTGLLDAEDQEIYEGDIVLVKRICGTFDEPRTEEMVLQVKYYPSKGFKAYWGHKDYNSEPLEGSKILGNIHQNPELLAV